MYLFANLIAILQHFQPILWNLVLVEIVVLGLLFLLCQQLANLRKISITKLILPLNDVANFVQKWLIALAKLQLNLLYLCL